MRSFPLIIISPWADHYFSAAGDVELDLNKGQFVGMIHAQ